MSSRIFAPGDPYGISFTIKNTSGALANADSLPVGAVYRNGTVDGAVTVTVASSATGIYQATCTIPVGYALGDRVSLLIAATVGGVATGDFVDHIRLDTPVNTRSTFAGGAVASVTGNVGGNVAGSVGSVTGLTNATIATAVWQDATGSDFTAAGSIGKSLYTSGNAPGAANGLFIAGTNAATTVDLTGSLSGSVGSVAGAVGSISGVSFPANFPAMAIDAGGHVKLQGAIQKDAALAAFPFYMALSSDHFSPGTGRTITATRSLDGGAFAACANAAAETGGGWYRIDLAASDLGGNTVALSFAATGCDATLITIATQP